MFVYRKEKFAIIGVKPKSGTYKKIHEELIGKKCWITNPEKDTLILILYEEDKYVESFSAHTSIVLNFTESADKIDVETENTFYTFLKLDGGE